MRRQRPPAPHQDDLPAEPPPLISPNPNESTDMDDEPFSRSPADGPIFQTLPDKFGVYRVYPGGRPSFTPDESYTISDSVGSSNISTIGPASMSRSWFSPLGPSLEAVTGLVAKSFAPFPNESTFHLMSWFYSSSNTKSHAELDRLVNEVILAPNFLPADLVGFRAAKEASCMDRYLASGSQNDSPPSTSSRDEWIETSVFLSLPCDGIEHPSEADAPKFEVKGLYHRRIVDVIRSALAEPAAQKFHLFPFREYWKPSPDEPTERIYSEAFTSDYFLEQYEKIRVRSHTDLSKKRLPVLIGLMIWSDSTHLASFGTASLWPIYLYFGNQSKYTRAKPSEFAAHHLAYVPKVISSTYNKIKSHEISLVTMSRRATKSISVSLLPPKCSLIYGENLCRKCG